MSVQEPSHYAEEDMVLVAGSDYIRMASIGGGLLSIKLPNSSNEQYETEMINEEVIGVKGGTYIIDKKLYAWNIRESGISGESIAPNYILNYHEDSSIKETTYTQYILNDISSNIENIYVSDVSVNSLESYFEILDNSFNNNFSVYSTIDNSYNIQYSETQINDISINEQITNLQTNITKIELYDASLNIIDNSLNSIESRIGIIDSSFVIISTELENNDNQNDIIDLSLNIFDMGENELVYHLQLSDVSINYFETEFTQQPYGDTFSIGENSFASGVNSFAIGYNSSVTNVTNSAAIGNDTVVDISNVIVIGNGSHKVGINTVTPSKSLDVNGTINTASIYTEEGIFSQNKSKIVVQNGQNGGSSKGIYLWRNDITNWGIYMAQPGAGRALDDGTAPAGSYFTSHAVRFRCHNDSSNGFIFENSDNTSIFSIRSDGYTWANHSFRCPTWFRTEGSNGWYSQEHGGGIQMIDTTYVRTSHSKGFSAWQAIHLYTSTAWWSLNKFNDQNLGFFQSGTLKAYVEDDWGTSQFNFTGQHTTYVENINYYDASYNQGLIVCANKNAYINMNEQIYKGNKAITQDECLPIVSLSNKTEDKTCFGVISGSEDSEKRIERFGNFVTPYEKEQGDTRIHINSIGEGAMWVSNRNGPLESGDYITTTDIPGYGMKQDLEILCNYTVAKITMDCDFNPQLQPKEIILKQESLDASGNTIYENILDVNGMIQWTNELDTSGNIVYEHPYNLRYLDLSGNRYTKHEYDIKLTDEEELYIAAYVGCTYHCG